MSHPVLVSVVISTYNQKDYIAQCLESVLIQKTTFPIEVIIGEDDSKDGTRNICKKYAENYPDKIQLILRSREDVIFIKGKATGRFNFIENTKAAKGKYIAICEGDDYWDDPLKLQKQVDMLEANPKLIASHHWQKIATKIGKEYIEQVAPKTGHGYYPKEIASIKHVFSKQLRLKSRTLMFRNIIDQGFFPDWFKNVAFGDVPLTFLLGKHGDFGFIDEEMAVYRITGNGVSTNGLKDLGENKFKIQFFKNWIQIWDLANIHYNYKYNTESNQTVLGYYKTIIKHLPNSYKAYFSLLKYNSTEREVPFFKTIPHSIFIIIKALPIFVRKIKKRIK